MPINNGEDANEANFNRAFWDREGDTDTTGKVSLLESSSPDVIDLQATIGRFQQAVFTQSPMTIIGLFVNSNVQVPRVAGSGGAVTLNAAPFGTITDNFINGMLIHVTGMDDTNTVTIENNDIDYGCLMNGNITLSKYDIITFIYDSIEKRFIEVSRNG